MDRAERVRQLKRDKQEAEAIPILFEWVHETEKDPSGVTPWPYEQLAIIQRKLGNLDAEQEILERFAAQEYSPGKAQAKLLDRLLKVYGRKKCIEERAVEGEVILWHTEYDSALDEIPPFRRTGLIVDVETTGLSRRDEVIEFAGILFEYSRYSGRVLATVDRYQGFREPRCEISPGAMRVHRIRSSDVRGKRLDHARIRNMLEEADIILAHNAPFDRRFLSVLFQEVSEMRWYCTMRGCSWEDKGFPSKKLDDLLDYADIARERSHRALHDAEGLLSLISHRSDPSENHNHLFEILLSTPLSPSPQHDRAAEVAATKDRSGCASVLASSVLLLIMAWVFALMLQV